MEKIRQYVWIQTQPFDEYSFQSSLKFSTTLWIFTFSLMIRQIISNVVKIIKHLYQWLKCSEAMSWLAEDKIGIWFYKPLEFLDTVTRVTAAKKSNHSILPLDNEKKVKVQWVKWSLSKSAARKLYNSTNETD